MILKYWGLSTGSGEHFNVFILLVPDNWALYSESREGYVETRGKNCRGASIMRVTLFDS